MSLARYTSNLCNDKNSIIEACLIGDIVPILEMPLNKLRDSVFERNELNQANKMLNYYLKMDELEEKDKTLSKEKNSQF